MKKLVTATVFNSLAIVGLVAGSLPASAAAVPCEQMLSEMRAAKASAKLSDVDSAKVNDLETKAVERCNADDDTRSDKFLADALKILGK
ncbi:hypothetical protein [Rhizobium sp. BK251]|uniref:hypothetical protein n=1 Tax=Rhizobium sp. BK251 TaxID=2512125 RepID=UPI001053F105|nr:hypothetical protein [Rhizobium sp. BK251]TCL69432.1 hypothetical protein EV286_1084 [Rhizobium sp. BK251]